MTVVLFHIYYQYIFVKHPFGLSNTGSKIVHRVKLSSDLVDFPVNLQIDATYWSDFAL